MNIERTLDAELIKGIITRPDMWRTVAEDGVKVEGYAPDLARAAYLSVSVGGAVVAIYQLMAINSVCLEIHAHVLPEYRSKYADKTGRAVLKWIYDTAPQYNKVVVFVPVLYKNVRLFTCRLGFKEEGLNRASYLKNGIIVDQWLLGITRAEIGELICRAS